MLEMKLQNSSARPLGGRVVETKNLGVAEERCGEGGENEKLSWGVACERGREGEKESSADGEVDEEGPSVARLLACCLLLSCTLYYL